MRNSFRAESRGETPFPEETFEEFVGLDAPRPRARTLLKSIPFVLAGVVLATSVAIFGNYLGQNNSVGKTTRASMAVVSPQAVSLVGKSAFRTKAIDIDARGYSYDIGQQVTASLKGDRIGNLTVIHRNAVAKRQYAAARPSVGNTNGDFVITPASARANEPISSSVLTPSIRKLESVWRRGRKARRSIFSGRSVSRNEHYCLAKAIYFEARSESKAGQLAVANVVMNRVKSKNFPKTICGVVYENRSKNKLSGCQFSFTCDGRDDKPRRGKQWNKSKNLATKVMKGQANTRVVNSSVLHYHADYVRPKWSYVMRRLTKIGRHIFYTGT